MAVYTYEAINNMGKTVKSTYEANNREEVLVMLEKKNLYPIMVQEGGGASKEIKASHFFQRVKLKDIAFFCRQVYSLLNAGIPIADTLQIISGQIVNKNLQKAVVEVSEEVQTGIPFSEAMKKQNVFPALLIHMVAAGEASGTLNFVMRRMAEDYEKEFKMQKRVSGAMVYPTLIIIVAVVAVTFLITSVLPRFVEMFASANVELPAATQMLINISGFLQQYWLYLLVALILFICGCKYFVRTAQGRFWVDTFKLSLPIIGGVNNKIVMARFSRTLSSLLKSGIPLMQSMEYVAAVVGNQLVSEKLLVVREEIAKGASLTDSVNKTGVFDPIVIHMLKIGEDSGKLDEVMENTATVYDQEVEVAVQGLTSIIEPLMIILMAVVVGLIVFSIITPMFDIAKTVGG
jgi:type IV pilus assembly protein PilC